MQRVRWFVKFVVVQALVLFLIVEIGLRVAHPFSDNLRVLLYLPTISTEFDELHTVPELLETTIIGYRPHTAIAGFVRNSRGFRSPEYSEEKDPETLRIVVLGDSFTFSSGGIPWSDSWLLRLERELQQGRGDRVELLNLGVPGVGPLFERRLWQVEGSRLNADVCLLVLFVGNDFTDHARTDLQASSSSPLVQWSYAVRLVRNGARVLADRGRTDVEAEELERPFERGGYELPEYRETFATRDPLMTRDRLMSVEAQRARLCEHAQSEGFEELLERMVSVVVALEEEVTAAGVDFRVVVLPDRYQVNVDEKEEVLRRLGMTDRDFDWDKPQRELGARLGAHGIDHLDLLETFREITKSEQLFDPGNTHWNVRGNAVVGEAIAEWLAPRLPPEGS